MLNSRKGFESNANKQRASQIKENLLKSFQSFRTGPEIFYLLSKYLQRSKLKLSIPDTLIYIPSFTQPVYLSTNPDGFIEIDSSKSSCLNFFSKIEPHIPCHPRFIHIAMNQRIRLCFSKEEAKKIFEECPHFSHRLHRWVSVNQNFASKLRVHWKSQTPSKAFIITNRISMINNPSKTRSKISLPSIKMYSDSKNPLEHKNAQDLSRFVNIGEGHSLETKKFLVQFNGTLSVNITSSSRYMPELQNSFTSIVTVINSVFFNNPNRLQELLLDFVKSNHNEWVLISCKGHKVKGDFITNNLKQVESSSALNISHVRGPSAMLCESVTEESLKSDETFDSLEEENEEIERTAKRIEILAGEMEKNHGKIVENLNNQTYLDLKQSDSMGRIPHIMIGILPHKIEKPISYFVEKAKEPPIKPVKHKDRGKNLYWASNEKINPETYTKITAKCLNDVVKVYNKHRNEAKLGRINLIEKKIMGNVFSSETEGILKALEITFFDKSSSFNHFLENKSEKDVIFKTRKMMEIVSCSSEYIARKKVRMLHCGIGISGKQYEDFLKDLEKNVKVKVVIRDDELNVLMNRFRSFKHDVVSE
jgi:hypothetical protein